MEELDGDTVRLSYRGTPAERDIVQVSMLVWEMLIVSKIVLLISSQISKGRRSFIFYRLINEVKHVPLQNIIGYYYQSLSYVFAGLLCSQIVISFPTYFVTTLFLTFYNLCGLNLGFLPGKASKKQYPLSLYLLAKV